MIQQVVLSGIRASGDLHIGNYLGAIKNFVTLSQNPGNVCLFFVANLHSLTTCPDPEMVRVHQEDIVRMYLACGIKLERSYFYLQHTIPEVLVAGIAFVRPRVIEIYNRLCGLHECTPAWKEGVR